ncbi:tyrosine-type recombinase/integrase [Candidatus Bipolaricaulota bacterium]|nr:tyrosine-type recombinase/integrase [Candidatus Bipolaricaulota bacterium]
MQTAILTYKSSLKNLGNNGRNSKTNAGRDSDYCDLSLREAINEFIRAKRIANLSEATFNIYDYVFDEFTDFWSDDLSVGAFDKEDFRRYLAELQRRDIKQSTVSIHYRNLNTLFNWLVSEDYLEENLLNEVPEPKTEDTNPNVLSEDQVDTLLKTAKTEVNRWTGQRNYVMLLMFVETGLRVSELISAKISKYKPSEHELTVCGKGRKERIVSWGSKVAKPFRKWLDRRDELDKIYDDTIFISENGEKLKRRNVQRIVTRIQEKAGLGDEKVSPHCLRRTSATLAAKYGMRERDLKKVFGWSKSVTAERYVNLSGRDVKDAYEESSPIDNLWGND